MRVFLCESCGGPIDAPWSELVIVCTYCGASNFPGRPEAAVPPRVPVDGRPRLNLGGRTYVLEGQIGDGDSCRVYRARWVVRLGELVVIKVLRAQADADLMRREWDTLRTLRGSSSPGADHYVTRLPSPIAFGPLPDGRLAAVYGWKSGFVHSLEQIAQEHPHGVPGEVVTWILKRLLELLGFVHREGFVHGAVVPAHVLVHPRDHGASLVGWTAAAPWSGEGVPLVAVSGAWKKLYPSRNATPNLDIAMACRCAELIGGWTGSGLMAPAALKRVLRRGRSATDAWALRDELVEASTEAFGPPAYHPLAMPGWGR